MRYRKLDENGDYSFGHGQADFWHDVPEAPAQAVRTRLSLWEGEWYLDDREGMGWRTRVLGERTAGRRDAAIRRHILGTQGVRSILAYSSALVRDSRSFTVNTEIDTVYGRFQIGRIT
jgi:hypothetical protein